MAKPGRAFSREARATYPGWQYFHAVCSSSHTACHECRHYLGSAIVPSMTTHAPPCPSATRSRAHSVIRRDRCLCASRKRARYAGVYLCPWGRQLLAHWLRRAVRQPRNRRCCASHTTGGRSRSSCARRARTPTGVWGRGDHTGQTPRGPARPGRRRRRRVGARWG